MSQACLDHGTHRGGMSPSASRAPAALPTASSTAARRLSASTSAVSRNVWLLPTLGAGGALGPPLPAAACSECLVRACVWGGRGGRAWGWELMQWGDEACCSWQAGAT